MEDVDEGFGSNESNHSNCNKETILTDLKYLNGQSVLDKNTNGNSLLNGSILKNGSQKVENSLDMPDDSKDLDLRNNKSISETSPCIGFAKALRDHNIKNCTPDEQSNSKELHETCLGQRSSNENKNSNCSLDSKGEVEKQSGKVSPINVSLSHINNKEGEVPNKCKSSQVEEMIVHTDRDSSRNSDRNSATDIKINKNKDCSENDSHETVLIENEMNNKCLDKMETIDRNALNKTPVKQHTSSAEGERSPFLLDDKVRNSLKGLVAKVKSSELSRESMSPAESSVSGDTDELASPRKLHEDDLSIEEETDLLESASMKDTDECDLEDCEDGISMEIGSENEDDLLEIDSDLPSSKKCNNEKAKITNQDKNIENCPNQKTNSNTSTELEDSNSAIEIDITSDNEDDAVVESEPEKEFQRFKHASIEKIQFEEDSNSNGNSGKINDIVNFLNHDLSGTNSPLTTSDTILIGDSKPEAIDKNVIDNQSSNADTKVGSDIEMAEVNDIEKSENNTNSIDIDQHTVIKSYIKGNGDNEKLCDDSDDKDETILDEFKSKEQKSNCENVRYSENERKDLENLNRNNSNSKLQENFFTGQLIGEEKVKELEEEDDDVIFEGASMPAMRNEYQKLQFKSVVKQSEDGDKEKTLKEGKDVTDNDHVAAAEKGNDDEEDDDDVIFEKETKVEVPSKQNCDIANKPCCADDGNTNVLTIENSPSDPKKEIAMIEDNSSEKVSVITNRNSSDRKRSAEDKDHTENESKRSKLDLTGLIGKLGSRVEPASIELSDDSDEEGDKSMKDTKELEDKSAVVKQVEESKPEKNERLITVTEKELEELVREKVKTYLTSQRDTLVAKLSQKVKDLQQNNDLWKRQVKDLQVKVNDVTVLQQKLEKRKAATAALRQITTRNVSVQVDEGRTASSKTNKMVSTPQRPVTQPPLVSATGNGTIRLPIQQSQQSLTSQLPQGPKVHVSTYQTPSVKSLLDTTRVQKTVGSMTTVVAATTTVNTSMLEFIPFTSTYVPKSATATFQGYGQPAVAQITTQNSVPKSVMVTKSMAVPKTVTIPSPSSTAKVIDLTDDDDSNKTRLVTLPGGLGAMTSQQGVRHVLAPPGTQFVRTGLPNQPTYQLVFSSPPAVRPGMMMTVASGLPQTAPLINTVQQSPTLVNLTSPTSVAPGTSLARAAVSATPTTQKVVTATHPAPFPALPPKQQSNGLKELPPKPCLKISRVSQGIVLSWNMTLNDLHAEISNYQLFAYQETSAPPVPSLWKKVGDVKALPLPMACTLTQFQVGNKYHFAVRAMDAHNRVGDFSDPGSIHLTPSTPTK
ncbi:activating transcription factor 7-interacting protein 1-like isoform X2 [Ruditapes philippinarum]|uniref:activating transcription factor 7-interacting protein 1-like isoform X2 n=1 Tax=Ruditapes philippinarum TaxID=129788 RepID=UPI00295BA14A|nr:activating transcription factor 7-interacting protein 1-like isoform X2 [Ruditapes philippinarum]